MSSTNDGAAQLLAHMAASTDRRLGLMATYLGSVADVALTLEGGSIVDLDLVLLRDRLVSAQREIAAVVDRARPLLALLDGPQAEVEARLASVASERQASAIKWLADFTADRGGEG